MQDPRQVEQLVRLALERVLAREARCPPGGTAQAERTPPAERKGAGQVVLGSDHGGFELKKALVEALKSDGWRVQDLGTHSADAVDYPDFALKVAAAVAKGDAWRGIMVDGVGIGSSMAANKVPGIRAAVCFDAMSTKNSREHNDGNVMCIGSKVMDLAKARELATIFLSTDFGGDRHAKRIDKIVAIERLFLGAGAGR